MRKVGNCNRLYSNVLSLLANKPGETSKSLIQNKDLLYQPRVKYVGPYDKPQECLYSREMATKSSLNSSLDKSGSARGGVLPEEATKCEYYLVKVAPYNLITPRGRNGTPRPLYLNVP